MLPNITGNTGSESGGTGSGAYPYSGAFGSTTTYYDNAGISAARRTLQVLTFGAKNSNAVYGRATTVQPASLLLSVFNQILNAKTVRLYSAICLIY